MGNLVSLEILTKKPSTSISGGSSPGVVMSFLNMGISVDNEGPEKSSIFNSYKWILILSITVGALFTFISLMFSNEILFTRALIGGLIVFICFLAAFSVGYFIKKNHSDGLDD
ncbi:Uncharacterised protein [Clostridium putrefaciens]|uniref:Uncharacterized protein n=1 Tax=Clostridium putrefaciens TaxID=99675 RepID=A0A381JAH1_9CLOT|nr:hypothetical protein [Clostridium putrefaciens]SUY48105.1 Uncharacterised protein [Clostridium putrefaciens]